jgi:hypothetical protein
MYEFAVPAVPTTVTPVVYGVIDAGIAVSAVVENLNGPGALELSLRSNLYVFPTRNPKKKKRQQQQQQLQQVSM